MREMSRLLIYAGIILIIVGVIWQFGGKQLMIGKLGKLPGDIAIDKGNFKLYFPITTSIIISIVLSVLLWLFLHFRK